MTCSALSVLFAILSNPPWVIPYQLPGCWALHGFKDVPVPVEVFPGHKEESSVDSDVATLLIEVESSLNHHNHKDMRAEFEILTSNWHTWVIENALLCEAKLRKRQIADKLEDAWEIESEAKLMGQIVDKTSRALTFDLAISDRKAEADIVKWKFELAIRRWPELPCDAWPVGRLVHCVNDLSPAKECNADADLDMQLRALVSLRRSVQ
jgi:hypothetical protein